MKRWALLVAFLYFLLIVVLTGPVVFIAFWPESDLASAADLFVTWQYWIFVAVLVLSQAALLVVPVGIANRRPITRRPLLLPIAVTGFMLGALVIGAGFALNEFISNGGDMSGLWVSLAGGALTWMVWTVVFYRLSRNADPADVISRQCRALLKGSILELLIAIPTHIIARSRDYCCAGLMTFVGLTLGISVMLLSYGPGVFFLFVDRWNRTYQHHKLNGDSAP